MGGSFVEGLLKSETFKPADITVADPYQPTLNHFAEEGASVTTDNKVAAIDANIVAVVVKPWLVEGVLKGIKDVLDYKHQLLIVIAAGVKSEQIKLWLDKGNSTAPHFFMIIPNIAIAQKASMTFIVPVDATDGETKCVTDIFDELGGSIITEERLLAAGTTLASCGIAYAMRYIRASVEGGVELGFKAKDAEKDCAPDRERRCRTASGNGRTSRICHRQGHHSWRCHHQRPQRNGTCGLHQFRHPRTESWSEITYPQ
jgi:pyrroline-5-carboxylate reductase